MKRLPLFWLPAILLLVLTTDVAAQLFQQPQPLMFDRGFDQYAPPTGTKKMVMSRYIPGARFPKDYDVVVETYEYNPKGQLTDWRRFQNITGEPTLETTYTWAPEGHLLQERVFVANDKSEIVRNYVWAKDETGAFTKAVINDKAGKAIGTVAVQADGSQVITENSLSSGKVIISTFSKEKRLLKMENTASGQIEVYTYYADGTVKDLNITSSKGVALVKYENKLDEKGRVIQQTETGKTTPRTFYFNYDAQGHMIDRGTIQRQPTESRHYDTMGRLWNTLTYDAQGLPKEVQNISYECFDNQ